MAKNLRKIQQEIDKNLKSIDEVNLIKLMN